MSVDNMTVFTGNANPALAEVVARRLGIPLGKAVVSRFSDGEVMVEIMEHVRGTDVFIMQPTCAPCNDNLMELLIMIDAFRRSSAQRITAVIPYYGYARPDRRPPTGRVALGGRGGRQTATHTALRCTDTLSLIGSASCSSPGGMGSPSIWRLSR